MKAGLRELDYRRLGTRWRAVIAAAFLLLLPFWLIVIRQDDYRALYSNEIWLGNLDNAIVIAGVSVAFYVTLTMARKLEGTRFGPGIGLLALGLFFLGLNDIFWWAASLYEDLYLLPEHGGNNALLLPDTGIYWILATSEHYFAFLEGLFIILAAFALKEIFEEAAQLQIEIDREKAKREASRVMESDYFQRVRREGLNIRRDREKS